MSGLAWLNELMLWLGKWFPRPVLIKAGHRGVKYGPRGSVMDMAPGLYCYWPITTDVIVVSTRPRTFEIAAQLLGREVMAVVASYTLADPQAVLLAYNDVFSQLDDRTQALLGQHYDAEAPSAAICAGILAGLRNEFGPHGVEIHSVDVHTRGRVIPLKNLNDWAQHAKAGL